MCFPKGIEMSHWIMLFLYCFGDTSLTVFSIPSVSVPCPKVRALCAKQTIATSWLSIKGETYYFCSVKYINYVFIFNFCDTLWPGVKYAAHPRIYFITEQKDSWQNIITVNINWLLKRKCYWIVCDPYNGMGLQSCKVVAFCSPFFMPFWRTPGFFQKQRINQANVFN